MLDAGRSRAPIGARGAAALVALCAGLASGVASAQAADPAPGGVPAPPAPAPSKEPEAQRLAPVEITGGRGSDSEQRRQSTAAKIIVGREEIERHGDATLGEILKRLPGVTLGGPPGRGGQIRFRGLGAGYTQILLDGDRVPPGFQIDSISPEQIERIEILRAPTAETGARAIGGTINIITREDYSRKLNDVRIGTQFENDHLGAGGSWTRNDRLNEQWTLNFSLSASGGEAEEQHVTTTTDTDLATGDGDAPGRRDQHAQRARKNLHLSTRAQYQDDQGQLRLRVAVPRVDEADATRFSRIVQPIGIDPPPYDHAVRPRLPLLAGARARPVAPSPRRRHAAGVARQRRRVADPRAHGARRAPMPATSLLATVDDSTRIRDRSLSGGLKASKLLDNDHSLVGGIEGEGRSAARRAPRCATARRCSPTSARTSRPEFTQRGLPAGRVDGQSELGRARRPALGGHPHARHRRRRPAAEQPQQRVDAAAACGVEARPEGPRPDPHEPHAQLQGAHAEQPARPAELSSRFPVPGANTPPAPTAPATPT